MQIESRNTNTLSRLVYPMFEELERAGRITPSRNGPVVAMPEPVLIRTYCPWERVNVSPTRDANPFFHLIEALAMFVGYNSVELMVHFAKTMALYSDDGKTYNAFYGTRARRYRWGDQMQKVISILQKDPQSRQAVVQLWDPDDLDRTTKDKACNMSLVFQVVDGQVLMTSFNRSNDAVKGFVSGANMVHLSMFHEYVACSLGMEMGSWWHCSNNFHIYTEDPVWKRLSQTDWGCEEEVLATDYYGRHLGLAIRNQIPIFDHPTHRDIFDNEVTTFLRHIHMIVIERSDREYPHNLFTCPFLAHVAVPMFNAWQHHRRKDYQQAIFWAECCSAFDWSHAAVAWLKRREDRLARIASEQRTAQLQGPDVIQ